MSTAPAIPRRHRRRGPLAAVLAFLLLAAGLGSAAPASAAESDQDNPVVLIGMTGLRWDDLGSLTTPTLWSLSREGSVGTSVVRSTHSFTCPSAGWLAVSAGGRADDVSVSDGTCRTLSDPLATGTVPGWADYIEATNASSYDSQLGLLGDTVAASGLTATSIGPGAAIALADADGTPVGTHIPAQDTTSALRTEVANAMKSSDLLIVDAGTVRDPGYQTRSRTAADDVPADNTEEDPDVSGTDVVIEPTRAEQVQAIDAQIDAIMDGINREGTNATVYIVSLADSSRRPNLQLATAIGPAIGGGDYNGGMLQSSSTQQDGFLQATDITPTLLTALGIRDQAPSGALVGSTVTQRDDGNTATARVAYLIDQNRHAQAAKPLVSSFYVWWVALNLALYALVTVGLNNRVRQWFVRLLDRWRPNRVRGRFRITPQRVLRALRIGAVVVSAVPVSTFLANLLPWWRAGSPGWALAAVVSAFSAVIALLALLPPWRSSFLGPLGTVAGITALVLTWDVATGARLALDSMMGPGALVAGRFYGFGNPAFALFATAMVLVALSLANPLARRGHRWAAAGVVAVIGMIATAVDGIPSIGADFGGPPALVPGFAIMALLVAGIRLNWRRIAGVLVAGAVVVIGIATLDYLRPADDRTHLGRFIETVLDGGLWTVLLRKGQANLGILFGSEQTLLAIGGILLVVVLLGRPARNAVDAPDGGPYAWLSAGAPLRRLATDAPVLMPALIGLSVTLFLGFALNDSGVVVPATGIGMAVPLLVAASATWMLTLQKPVIGQPVHA